MEKFDLIIIGGGPAGYHGAERAAHQGMKTLLIEKNRLGGVCLNEGCIPSKTFLNSAKVYSHAIHGESFGVFVESARFDQNLVVNRKNTIVRRLIAGVKAQLRQSGVTVVEEAAILTGKNEEGFLVHVGETDYVGTHLMIATGSIPAVPPIEGLKSGLEQGFVMTNKEILDLKVIPERLCVIGGGVIGLEMAAYFSAVGSQVDVIEMLGKIAGPTEDELSSILQKALEKKGVRFHLNAKVSAVTTEGVIYQQDHQEYLNKADKVLLSIGRRPFTAGLGLETIGVEMAKNGAILTNEKLQTNVEGVYAAGDVNGKSMLAHTAYREAEVAVHNMLNQPDQMFYECIPSVIYTTPEVATAGLTEKDAENKGIETVVLSLPITFSGRHVAESTDSDGLCKLIVNKKNNTLIGAHLVGSYASEIIVMLSSMMQLEVDIQTILKLVFPHPTVGEIIKDTLSQLY